MTKSYKQTQTGFTFWGGTPEFPELEEDLTAITNREEAQSFPLTVTSVGERLKIFQIHSSKSNTQQLNEMGVIQGAKLEVLNLVNGSVVFTIGKNRIGLGAAIAERIFCVRETLP